MEIKRLGDGLGQVRHGAVAAAGRAVVEVKTDAQHAAARQQEGAVEVGVLAGAAQGGVAVKVFLFKQVKVEDFKKSGS